MGMISGQVVVITGAAGNLGRATADAFRAKGAALALLDVNLEALRKAYGADSTSQSSLAADLTRSVYVLEGGALRPG